MRILHTSDWHIGKRLQSKSRVDEQKKTLDELAYICRDGKIDLVLIAGDIFDVSVPSAEAEEVFYSAALNIAKYSRFVAIAGNHDDPCRLSAPRGIAKASDIILIGGLDNSSFGGESVTAGEGWLRMSINHEILNLALLPYPSLSRMAKLNEMEGETYEEKIKGLIDLCCSGFTADGINVFCSHLFISGSESVDGELGGAQMLPASVLPNCTYTALGHIHKPQTASRSKNAFYSGSLLNYSFDDVSDKRYILIDTDGTKTTLQDVPVTTGRKTVRVRAQNIAESLDILEKHRCDLVELIYAGSEPLRPSDVSRLKAFDSFCKLNIEIPFIKKERLNRQSRTTAQLFSDFYKAAHGVSPHESVVNLFLKVIEGEDI